MGLRQVTYTKMRHFHGLVFRKPSQEIQNLTAKDVRDENDLETVNIESMFYIPQDITENSTTSENPINSILESLIDNLNRDVVVSDFHELPNLEL